MKMTTSRRKSKIALLSLSIMTALSMQAYAEEEQFQLSEVVVTATRTERDVKETPAAVEVIDREALDKLGARNLLDALRLATSVNVTSTMTGNGISVRGMESRHVLILVDGLRLTSEGSQATGNSFEWQRINMANVERIEIVRGLSSSLYGSEALGGVINIITKKPGKEEITLSYSPSRYSDDTGLGIDQFAMHYDAGKKGPFSYGFTVGRSETDALHRPGEVSTTYNGTRDFYNFAASYELSGDRQLDFKADYLKEDMENISKVSSVFNHFFYDNTRKSASLGLRGKHDRGDYEVRTYFGQQDKQQDYRNLNTNVYYPELDLSKRKTWVLEGRNTSRLDERHVLTTGVEMRTESYTGTRLKTGKSSIEYTAFYIQDEYQINDRWLILPSLRYDDSNKFDSNVSPKIGATYKMNDNSRLKFNAGKGYRTPSLDDMYMRMYMQPMSGMPAYINGNPDLKPEESTNYEVAVEGERGKAFAKASYFNNDVKNKITSTVIKATPPMEMQYINIDRAEIKGMELEFGQHLTDNWLIKVSYTQLDPINTKTKEQIVGTARKQGTIQLHYDDRKQNGISAALWNSWSNDFYQTDSSNVKRTYSFNTWNVSVTKEWNENFQTYIGVDNIFNKKVYDLNIWGSLLRVGLTVKL